MLTAFEIARHGLIVETGRVSMSGTTEALSDNPAIRRAYLGIDDAGTRLAAPNPDRHDIELGAGGFHAGHANLGPRMSGWFPAPAGATERRVATDRLTINIVEAGSGPVVLLLHGLGWDHSLWNPTVSGSRRATA